jgi:chromosome segregation ATPase
MGFFRALAAAHGKNAIQAVTSRIVELDPKTATEAQLAAMEDDLHATATKLAQFRAEAVRERKIADDDKIRNDRMQAAGEQMYAAYQAETDPDKKASLEKSLMGLRDQIVKLNDELSRDEAAAKDAEALVSEAEAAVTEKGQHIMEAKTALQNALRDRDRALMAKDQAEQRQHNAEELAGLRTSEVGGLNSALNILTKQAADARVAADAARVTTAQITVVDPGTSTDPNVLAALSAVDTKGSPNDLAALFAPKSSAALKIAGS